MINRENTGLRASGMWAVVLCCVLLSIPIAADAKVRVDGARQAFADLVNSLLGNGVTVTVDKNSGAMTMQGAPQNEFGRRLKTMIDDARSEAAIQAARSQPNIGVGGWRPYAVPQMIDIDDVMAFPIKGNGEYTRAAVLIHEIQEKFDTVSGRRPGNRDPNHNGSATTAENAVLLEESGIRRTSNWTNLVGFPGKGQGGVVRYQAEAESETHTYLLEMTEEWQRIGANASDRKITKVEVVQKRPKPDRASGSIERGLMVAEQEPGVRKMTSNLVGVDFLPLSEPGYMDLDAFGGVYVVDSVLKEVIILGRDLSVLKRFQSPLLTAPGGVAADVLNNRLYVANDDQVLVFDLSTFAFLTSMVPSPSSRISGLELDMRGDLWVSDYYGNRVLHLDPVTGQIVDELNHPLLNGPEGIAISQSGDLWVSSYLGDLIIEFDSTGSFVRTIGEGVLDGPTGIALGPNSALVALLEAGLYGDASDLLYVSSYLNDQVVAFDLDDGSIRASEGVKTPMGIISYYAAIPEPSTFLLALVGLVIMAAVKYTHGNLGPQFSTQIVH